MSNANILFILTGSIAAYKACDVVSQLVQRGHRVRTVATESASKFVGPATLEGLTGQPVYSDLFAAGRSLEHINLTRWADLVIVCPATAHTINRLATGLADDLTGALFLAHDRSKPWLIAPAMNPAMWAHPATTAAVARLKEWGVAVLPVGAGRTACGEIGEGRLTEPATILASIESALARPVRRMRILVTAGGTAEPIDGVRVISNTSTGATGAGLATYLRRQGHEVVLLRARSAARAETAGPEEEFGSAAELDAALGRHLGGAMFDAVIHAAAVSDFGVEAIEQDGRTQSPANGKLSSHSAPVLRLKPLPKLVDGLRARSANRRIVVVAFKLTRGATPPAAQAAIAELFQRALPDFIVHNDLCARTADGTFPADIHRADGSLAAHCPDRADLAIQLEQLLIGSVGPV
jgi:phosphopantothenoylcysteine decarboxylase/phosphopantothenate--cysteine ligase